MWYSGRMAKYYWTIFSEVFQSLARLRGLALLGVTIIVALLFAFNEPVGKWFTQGYSGISPAWAIVPIVVAGIWAFLEINYVRYCTLETSNTKLKAELEEVTGPRLKIVFKKGVEPYEHTEPANATDKTRRLYRVQVLNEGKVRMNTCAVKLIEIDKITNVHIPAVLKQRNDNPSPSSVNRGKGVIEFAQYKQTFPLNAGDDEFIDVASLDEKNPASEIMLCYAKSSAEAYPGIPRDRYVLKLRGYAEIGEFCEAIFSLYVENGILHFERLH